MAHARTPETGHEQTPREPEPGFHRLRIPPIDVRFEQDGACCVRETQARVHEGAVQIPIGRHGLDRAHGGVPLAAGHCEPSQVVRLPLEFPAQGWRVWVRERRREHTLRRCSAYRISSIGDEAMLSERTGEWRTLTARACVRTHSNHAGLFRRPRTRAHRHGGKTPPGVSMADGAGATPPIARSSSPKRLQLHRVRHLQRTSARPLLSCGAATPSAPTAS